MIGSAYKIDNDFKNAYLFGDPQIARWVSLKAASFEFANDDNDFMQQELPSAYTKLTLRQL